MTFELRAADLELADVESALLRAAVGDYAAEAAVLLLAGVGHWLPQLQAADLIAWVDVDDPAGPWAQVAWPELDAAVLTGRITGSSGQLRLLRTVASLADGQPVDLGDVTARPGPGHPHAAAGRDRPCRRQPRPARAAGRPGRARPQPHGWPLGAARRLADRGTAGASNSPRSRW